MSEALEQKAPAEVSQLDIQSINGLCAAGRATLDAQRQRMDRQDEAIASLRHKIDRITWLLVTTLTAATLNFLYMVISQR